MSEIEEFEIIDPPSTTPSPKKDPSVVAIASARSKMTGFLERAVEIICELAETSENDRVRLAAAESIADRVGLSKSSTAQVVVSQAEHDIATIEAKELLVRIQENQAAPPTHVVPIDVLIVHEGEEVLAPS